MLRSIPNMVFSSSSTPCLRKAGDSTSNPITIDEDSQHQTQAEGATIKKSSSSSSLSTVSSSRLDGEDAWDNVLRGPAHPNPVPSLLKDAMCHKHEARETTNIPFAKSPGNVEHTERPKRDLDCLIQYDGVENYTLRQGIKEYERSIEGNDDTIVVDPSLPGDKEPPKTNEKERESRRLANESNIKKGFRDDENERPAKKRKVDGEKPEKRQYNKTGEYTKGAIAARKTAKAEKIEKAREDIVIVPTFKRKYTKRAEEVEEASTNDSNDEERAVEDDSRSKGLADTFEEVEERVDQSFEDKDRDYWTDEDWNKYWEKQARVRLQERKAEDEWLAQNWDRLGLRWQYFQSLSELDRCVEETDEDRTFREISVQRQKEAKQAPEMNAECEQKKVLSAEVPPTTESLDQYYGPPSCNSEWVVMVHPKHEVYYKPEWDEKRRQEAGEFTRGKEESGLRKYKDEDGRRRAKPRLTRNCNTVVWWQAIRSDAGKVEWSLTWDPNCGKDPKLCKCDL